MYLFLKEKHSSATDFFVHFLLLNLEMLLIKKKQKNTAKAGNGTNYKISSPQILQLHSLISA